MSSRLAWSWQGNPINTKDRERSFRLAQVEPVARLPGVRLYSLQKNFGLEQLEAVADRFPVIDLGPRLNDLVDTAAVMRKTWISSSRGTARGPSRRRPGCARLDAFAVHLRLALDDRPRRHPLVPHDEALPPEPAWRLGRAVQPAGP